MRSSAPSCVMSLPIRYLKRRCSFWLWIALVLPCPTVKPGPALPDDGLTLVVNATADDPDAIVGDGLCETVAGDGICTLRAAIEEANAQPTDDVISFDIPVTDPGYDGTSWTVGLLSALPELSGNLLIEGPGPGLLKVTRSSASLFRIFQMSKPVTVSISGLTLNNGNANGGNGGGI